MAKITLKNWLLSMSKWCFITYACLSESAEDLDYAINHMKCGYCKQDNERARKRKGYVECSGCDLFSAGLCGYGYDSYHAVITENPNVTWKDKQKAALQMLVRIVADTPLSLRRG